MAIETIIHVALTTLGEQTGVYVGGLAAGLTLYGFHKFRDWWKKRKERKGDLIPQLVGKDVGVYKILAELLLKADAGRAWVCQFHNGTFYANNASQMKFTCTHELVADGVSRVADQRRNLLISQYAETINDIVNSTSVAIDLGPEKDINDEFGLMLRSAGANLVVMVPLKNGSAFEGFAGICFLDDLAMIRLRHYPDKTDEEIMNIFKKMLEPYASKIGYILRK